MKKILVVLSIALTLVITGCRSEDADKPITVVSREDGSGTRGAFIELFGVLEKDGDEKRDMTTQEAVISNKTDAVIVSVSNDENAIGYISLGAYNDSVKLLNVDGVEATNENVANGTYSVFRPFNIAMQDLDNELVQDFVDFIFSSEGQSIVMKSFIPVDDAGMAYESSNLNGKLTIGGSTSVSPIMEKLAEAYNKMNPDVTIDIQSNGSSAGMSGAMNGTFDIGMASRELKDSESSELVSFEIAYDGIGIIVNNSNDINDISSEMVRQIYVGDITMWSELSE